MKRIDQYIEKGATLMLSKRRKELTRTQYANGCLELALKYKDVIPSVAELVAALGKKVLNRSYELEDNPTRGGE